MLDRLCLVDTNVLVRYLVADNADMHARAKRLIDSERQLGITSVVVLEVAHVLQKLYGYSRGDIVSALGEFLTRSNVPDEEEGGFTVRVPALPGCATEGDTLEEAIAKARQAIAGWIEAAAKHGEQIPEEKAPRQTITIDIAA